MPDLVESYPGFVRAYFFAAPCTLWHLLRSFTFHGNFAIRSDERRGFFESHINNFSSRPKLTSNFEKMKVTGSSTEELICHHWRLSKKWTIWVLKHLCIILLYFRLDYNRWIPIFIYPFSLKHCLEVFITAYQLEIHLILLQATWLHLKSS